MEYTSTDVVCSTKRSPTRCEEDPEPPTVKRAKIDANSLGDGAAAACPEHDGPPAPSVNLRIPEVSKEDTGCGIISRTDSDGELSLPLSAADIAKFEEDGFVMLPRAFDADVASACRAVGCPFSSSTVPTIQDGGGHPWDSCLYILRLVLPVALIPMKLLYKCCPLRYLHDDNRGHLWRRMQAEGIMIDNPATWVYKKPIAETYGLPSSPKKRRGYPWTSVTSPRLKAAVNQLLGKDTWTNFGCGWWMMTFPGFSQSPWGAEGKWHIDGAHFRHYPHSREVGLVPIFLLSDVHPWGGGTALLRGSHKKVAGILWERSGARGLTGSEVSNAARDALLPAAAEDIVETTGSAGDVMLMHPLLLHARSKNLAPVDPSGVRFMCHPAVPLKKHLDFQADPETFSPVQRVLWQSRPSSGIDGSAPIINPEDCDHSAVALPSEEVHKKRKWKRRKHGTKSPTTEKRANAAGCDKPTACDDEARGDSSSPQPKDEKEVVKDGSTLKSMDDSGCRGETTKPQSKMSDESREASSPQPVDEKNYVGDASPPQTEGENDARREGPMAQSIDVHKAEEDLSPNGKDYEEDAEILAVMGFSGFGHST